jgi:uncharacterized protein (UPF0333 family)
MDVKLLGFAVLLVIAGICYIATTSIGIQCSNENPGYKEAHPTNNSFLISHLVTAVLVTILGCVGIYLGVTEKAGDVSAAFKAAAAYKAQ